MKREIDAAILGERDAFRAQALLHDMWSFEMSFAGEGTEPVDDAVARQGRSSRGVQRPPDGPRRASRAEMLRDGSVRRHTTERDPGDDVVDPVEEVGIIGIWGHIVANL